MNNKLNIVLCIFVAMIFLVPPVGIAEGLSDEGSSSAGQDWTGETDNGIAEEREVVPGDAENIAPGRKDSSGEDDVTGANDVPAFTLAPNPDDPDPAAGRRHDPEIPPEQNPENPTPVDTDVRIKGAAMSISKVSLHYENGTATESLDHGEESKVSAKVTNEGRETDYMTEVEVDFYYLNDEGQRTYIGRDTITAIKGGGHSEVAEVNWTSTMLAEKIYVVADPDGSDGGPAEFTKEITINPADYFSDVYCPYPYGADEADGDVEYWIKIDNVGSKADTVEMKYEMLSGGASWKGGFGDDQDSTKEYDLASGEHAWASFKVSIPSSADKQDEASFRLKAYSTESDEYTLVDTEIITTFVRTSRPILVVDDDESNGQPNTPWCETNRYMTAALDDAGLGGMYSQVTGGTSAPNYNTMSQYDLIIWSTGYDWTGDIITDNNRRDMKNHLEDGNSVWINGENFFQANQVNGEPDYGKVGDEFYKNWMNVTWVRQNIGSPDYVVGQLGDPISDSALYITNEVHTPPQMICDEAWNENDLWASPFYDSGGSFYLGVHNQWQGGDKEYESSTNYANPYRSVLMGTGLETFGRNVFQKSDGSWGDPDRTDVVSRMASWLGVPAPFHGKSDLAPSRVAQPMDGSLTRPGKTVPLNVDVANFGQADFEGDLTVTIRIRDVDKSGNYGSYDEEWDEEIDLESLDEIIYAHGVAYPGTYTVESEWDVPSSTGVRYEIQVTVDAVGDDYSSNDVNLSYVRAKDQYDIATLSLESEKRCGYWGFGLVGTPAHFTAEIKNNGSAEETFEAYLSIKDPYSNELRNFTQELTMIAGETREVVWKWTPEKGAGIASATHPSYRNWVEDPYFIRAGIVEADDDWPENDHIGDDTETYRYCAVEYQTGAEESGYGWTFINKRFTGGQWKEFEGPNIWWDSEHWSYLDPSHSWVVPTHDSVADGNPVYENNVFGEAISPVIDFGPYFTVYFDIIFAGQTEGSNNDWEALQIKRVYEDWSEARTVWNRSGNYQGGYLTNGINLNNYAGELTQVRLLFKSNAATAYSGINLDNIIFMASAKDYFDADICVKAVNVDPLVDSAGEERSIKAEIKNVGEIETNEEGKVEVEVTVTNSEGYVSDIEDARQEIRDNI